MSAMPSPLSFSATELIRRDHARVIGLFHDYRPDAPPGVRQGLVRSACLALEVHMQIEEEIFYPAVRAVDAERVDRSLPEHEDIRRLIAVLRDSDPASSEYSTLFASLMRNVMHHVADEETLVLPAAEAALGEQMAELGRQMTKRRLQLMAPKAGEIAVETARARPAGVALAAAGTLAAIYAIGRAMKLRATRRPE